MARNHPGSGSEDGIGSIGALVGLAALLVVLLIVSVMVSLTLPSTSTTTTTTTSASNVPARQGSNQASSSAHRQSTTTTGSPRLGPVNAADVAACRSDVTSVQSALAAYQATNGSYPTPPAPWSAAAYPTNFAPLTDAKPPGPFLKMPPGDNHYVILWDASGRLWVEPPGTFTPAYDAGNDGTEPATCARVTR